MAANPGAPLHYPVLHQNPQSAIERKQRRTLLWLGAGEIVVGVVSMALAIAAICVASALRYGTIIRFDSVTQSAIDLTVVASGTWCGAVLMVTGVLGVCVKRHQTRMIYDISAVMSTLSALLMTCQTVLSFISAFMSQDTRLLQSIHWPLAVLGMVGIILAATHMSRAYARSCCRNKRPKYGGAVRYTVPQMSQPQQLVYPQHLVPQQQLVQLPNGQLLIVAAQPVVNGYPMMGTPPPAMSNIPHQVAHVRIPAEAAAAASPPQPPEYGQLATDTATANITPPAPLANTLVAEDQGKETVVDFSPPVENFSSPPEYTP